jgi:hypothetical protein
MLIKHISNINRAFKTGCQVVFERYSSQLVMLLNALWKKKLIVGYNIKKKGIKIYLKYNKGIPLLKSFLIQSKPSRLITKKLNLKYSFLVLTNS